MSHATMKPDGTVDVSGEAHRLIEVGHLRFSIERVRDARRIGEIDLTCPPQHGGGEDGAVIRQVAELLAGLRGLVPLQ